MLQFFFYVSFYKFQLTFIKLFNQGKHSAEQVFVAMRAHLALIVMLDVLVRDGLWLWSAHRLVMVRIVSSVAAIRSWSLSLH